MFSYQGFVADIRAPPPPPPLLLALEELLPPTGGLPLALLLLREALRVGLPLPLLRERWEPGGEAMSEPKSERSETGDCSEAGGEMRWRSESGGDRPLLDPGGDHGGEMAGERPRDCCCC